jgi:hypothetical protein
LRRGYRAGANSLWGTVTKTVRAMSLSDFFKQVSYELVIPDAKDEADAIKIAASILGIGSGELFTLLGFEVELK